MKRMNKPDSDLRDVCIRLLNREYDETAYSLSIEEFRRLYAMITAMRENRVPLASIVNLGREAIIQFSDISPQHFLVTGNAPLSEDGFGFVLSKLWYGPREKTQSFPSFFRSEILLNGLPLLSIFLFSFGLLWATHDDGLYDLISTLLIQAATVFLSIYLIFTVTQNQTLQSDRRLFEKGILQKYYADDRNITLLAILTIALTFINTMFVHLSQAYNLGFRVGDFTFDRYLWVGLTTAFTISLLFDTFLSVVNYYLERARAVLERNMVATVLHEDFEKHYNKADAPQEGEK